MLNRHLKLIQVIQGGTFGHGNDHGIALPGSLTQVDIAGGGYLLACGSLGLWQAASGGTAAEFGVF